MTDMIAHARSVGVLNPTLDLFKIPPTDLSMSSCRFVPINPFTTGINPVDFQIDPQEDYIDLNRSYFEVELQMKNAADNANLVAADTLFPVNNLAHSLFKQINVRLNGTLISPQTDTYHYKAYLETLLNNNRQDGETILQPEGWFNGINVPDALTANQLDLAHADFAALSQDTQEVVRGMKGLLADFVGGNKVTLRFKPYLEVFHLSKALVPGVQLQIQMYFNSPDMFTMRFQGAKALRLRQEDVKVKLYLAQVRVTASIYRELRNSMLEGKTVTYPTVRSEIRTYSHPADQRYFECNNPFHNQLPNVLVVALIEAAAFNGDVTKYPFSFKKFNVTSVKQLVRGEEYPYETLELQHDSGAKDRRGYYRLLQASGSLRKSTGNMIRREDWGQDKHCTLFVFDNTANGNLHSSVLNPKQSGDLRLVINFGANPGENLTVLLYGEFENILEIDRNKTVVYDVYQQ